MEELGVPGPMATAMTLALEGDVTDAERAAEKCEMQMSPGAGLTPPNPKPVPTATKTAPTPAPPPTSTPATPTATATTVTSTPAPTETNTLVITVAATPTGIPEYDRGEWKHWTDEDGDCQDARQEALIAESLEPVEYEDDRECRQAYRPGFPLQQPV